MRLDGFAAAGLIPFPKPIAIDFTKIKGPLIALVGRNHAGKSTLLQCMTGGAIDRETANRGPLKELAIDKTSYVETKLLNGAPWTIRQSVDAMSGAQSSMVLDAEGAPQLKSGKVTEFDAWRADKLPPTKLLDISIFRHQKEPGFLALKVGERKDRILRLKGIEGLEKKAERARKRATKEAAKLEAMVARIADEKSRTTDVAAAEEQLKLAHHAADVAYGKLAAAKTAYAEQCKRYDEAKAQIAAAEARETRRREFQVELAEVNARRDALNLRITECEEVLGEADEIRWAVAESAQLTQEIEALRVDDARLAQKRLGHQKDAQAARADAAEAEDLLKRCRARLEQLTARLADKPAIEKAAADLPELRAALAAAEERKTDLETEDRSRRDLYMGLLGQAENVAADVRGTVLQLEQADQRLARASSRLRDKPAIDLAVEGLADLRDSLADAEANDREAQAAVDEWRGAALGVAEKRLGVCRPALDQIAAIGAIEAERAAGEASGIACDAVAADDDLQKRAGEAPERLKAVEEKLRLARSAVERRRKQVQEAETLAGRADEMKVAEEDVRRAREEIAELEAKKAANKARSDSIAAKMIESGAAIHRLRLDRPQVFDACERAQAAVQAAERTAARTGEMAQAEADMATHRAEIENEEAELATARVRLAAAEQGEATALSELTVVGDRLQTATTDRERLAPFVNREAELLNAETRLAELRPQKQQFDDKGDVLAGQIDGLTAPDGYVPPVLPDVEAMQDLHESLGELETEARAAHSMIPLAEARLESAKDAVRRIGELEAERTALEQELSDWNLLAEALGRDGVQALEVDAAGPELTDFTNDLLHTCFGPRWTVRIETTYQSKDGKKQLEGCPVWIIDSVQNREKLVERLCGGEDTFIGEAVSLAFAMSACRQWNMRDVTLVRDESGAALDPIYARQYIAMLRRAVEKIGARHCIFVSHSKEVQELADARIEIADGEVRVA